MKYKKAYEMGKQAYAEGKKAAPVLDKNLMDYIGQFKGQKFGYSIPILKAWSAGWHELNLNNKKI